jgi:NADH-quinone oxidoreductase subunit A
MQAEYLGIVVLIAVAALICGAMVTLSWVLGPKMVTPYKGSPYECGVAPSGDTHERFPIKFYLVAIVFILFDIEVVFLWPWMTAYLGADTPFLLFSFVAFMIYMALWILGDVYALRVGAFDWDDGTSLDPAKFGEAPTIAAAPQEPAAAGAGGAS